jgi:Tol biopolymer transport system component
VRPAGALQSRVLDGVVLDTTTGTFLDFSPDGGTLVYANGSVVRRIPVSGGPAAIIADGVEHVSAVLWGEDDHIYLAAVEAAARLRTHFLRVSAAGGAVDTLLAVPALGGLGALLPGHRTLLVTATGESLESGSILAIDLRSRDTITVLTNADNPQWSRTGHLLALRDGNIIALPFDPVRLRALGAAVTIADSVYSGWAAENNFRLSRSGTLVYRRGAFPERRTRMALVSANGDVEPLPLPPARNWQGQVSPDGRRLVYWRRDGIWLFDLGVGTHRQLTTAGQNPIWSPDGTRIAFQKRVLAPGDHPGHIFAVSPDVDTVAAYLGGASTALWSEPDQWLADGTLLFTSGGTRRDIYRLQVDGSTTPIPVLNADWSEQSPRISPDGRWLAYQSSQGGSNRTHIRHWPDLSLRTTLPGRSLISPPLWAPDGNTLYVLQREEGSTEDRVVAYDLQPRADGMHVLGQRVAASPPRSPTATASSASSAQGGMATVYLAEDLKHNRKVAIKVLKPELAAVLGAERFVTEIKTTAALQHPHILPLFDSGEADGFLYYVMPYIEGETLRAAGPRAQLGVDEAVRITREVADALDYAHRHGVIHRDIKPENILLHDGRAMVADFGIALAVSAAAGGRMTETGLSLGTPHYMSPEQATAESGDHRAQRHLLAGLRALRDADRQPAAHGRHCAADHHEDHHR